MAQGVVHDRLTANRAGVSSTGNAAQPGGFGVGGPLPSSLVVQGGSAKSVDELIAGVDRGVKAGDVIKVGKTVELECLDTPGHTTVSYTHLRAHETVLDLVCRLLLEKKNKKITSTHNYHQTIEIRDQLITITPISTIEST